MASAAATVHLTTRNYGHSLRPDLKTLEPRWLAASPYFEQEHLLDLNSLDLQSQLLALALTKLQVANDYYANTRYDELIDFEALMAELRLLVVQHGITWTRQEFYVVDFRSMLKADIDNVLLFKLDKESHREAVESGGLLKYWYGAPNAERRNLATCFWRHREDAIEGGLGPWHKQARSIIPQMYQEISVKGLSFTIEDGVKSWMISPYQ